MKTQYLQSKKALEVELRSETAKLNYALKHYNVEMAESCRGQIAAIEKQLEELESE